MRLVDADALDDVVQDLNENKNYGITRSEYKRIDAVLFEFPTIEERKKGKWNCGDDMFEYAICSACKWDSGEAWEYAKKYFRYCPNCGARMESGA